ncbi:Metallo-hydrolase/oxidoreductase [Xylariaceae sp. FL0804]|nr:Metallo-hydrolase/oxidoreductase [Xylariaceae sp. FL0804]
MRLPRLFLCFPRAASRRPKQQPTVYRMASTGSGTMAAAMMAGYACTVAQRPSEKPAFDDAKAHHVKDRRGNTVKFQNPHPSHVQPSMMTMMSLGIRGMLGLIEWPRPSLDEAIVPVVRPSFLPTRTSASPGSPSSNSKLRATWLGHACYYVEFPSGLRVLFDPVFEDCCAPVALRAFRRYTPPPCALADLPFVDAVVISHSHYDHLSLPSVRELHASHPDAHFFVGLGLESWFRAAGIANVTEMDWWDEAELTLTPRERPAAAAAAKAGEAAAADVDVHVNVDSSSSSSSSSAASSTSAPISARIFCLPSQHSSGRTALDRDTTLWASWGVRSGSSSDKSAGTTRTVWFGGDTGYRTVPKVPEGTDDWGPEYAHLPACPQFRQIAERLGSDSGSGSGSGEKTGATGNGTHGNGNGNGIDLGLIPVGAYAPRHVFSHMHADPADAVEIFRDTGCRRAMGIHWGTWALTPEDPREPPRKLREALRRRGLPETGVFDVCDIGESREFD